MQSWRRIPATKSLSETASLTLCFRCVTHRENLLDANASEALDLCGFLTRVSMAKPKLAIEIAAKRKHTT